MDNNDATAATTSVAATDTGCFNPHVTLTDHNHNDITQTNSNLTSDNNPSYDAIVKRKFFEAKEKGKPSLFGDPNVIPTQVRAVNDGGGAPVPEKHWNWVDAMRWTKNALLGLTPEWMKKIGNTNPPKWYAVRCLESNEVVRVCSCFMGADPRNPCEGSLVRTVGGNVNNLTNIPTEGREHRGAWKIFVLSGDPVEYEKLKAEADQNEQLWEESKAIAGKWTLTNNPYRTENGYLVYWTKDLLAYVDDVPQFSRDVRPLKRFASLRQLVNSPPPAGVGTRRDADDVKHPNINDFDGDNSTYEWRIRACEFVIRAVDLEGVAYNYWTDEKVNVAKWKKVSEMFEHSAFKCPLCEFTHATNAGVVARHYKKKHNESFADSEYEDYDYEVNDVHRVD